MLELLAKIIVGWPLDARRKPEALEQFESMRVAICEALALLGSGGVDGISTSIKRAYDGNWNVDRTVLVNNLTALRNEGMLFVVERDEHQGYIYQLSERGRELLITWMMMRAMRLEAIAEVMAKPTT